MQKLFHQTMVVYNERRYIFRLHLQLIVRFEIHKRKKKIQLSNKMELTKKPLFLIVLNCKVVSRALLI